MYKNIMNFYTFSFNNPERKANMIRQFAEENIPLTFVNPVESTDPRVEKAPDNLKRLWSITLSHLDMLTEFLKSDAEFGVFCEDDIRLRKNIAQQLPEIMLKFRRYNLEILLLSYLCVYVPVVSYMHPSHKEIEIPYTYFSYTTELWGAHMYMMDRPTAKRMLEKYTVAYAETTLTDSSLTHFNPDWTLTKDAERKAAIYPMLSLEAGVVNTTHQGQIDFHKQAFDAHFDPAYYH
jgi:hypothetical protein